jgi:MFS family permease
MGALMFSYQATSFWFGTLLRIEGRAPLPYLIALNLGGILGAVAWGAIADTRLRPRGAVVVAGLATIAVVPLFLVAATAAWLWPATLIVGFTAGGIIGIAPAFIAGQFMTRMRGAASGVTYQSASVIGACAPLLLGYLQDQSWPLRTAMALSIATASAAAILFASGVDRVLRRSDRAA